MLSAQSDQFQSNFFILSVEQAVFFPQNVVFMEQMEPWQIDLLQRVVVDCLREDTDPLPRLQQPQDQMWAGKLQQRTKSAVERPFSRR